MSEWKDLGLGNRYCSIRDCGRKPIRRVNLATLGLQRFKQAGKGDWEPCTKEVELVFCKKCFGKLVGLEASSHGFALDGVGWDFLRRTIRRAYLELKHVLRSEKDCPSCKGTGDVGLNRHERQWDPCPDCDGSGVEGGDR